MAGTGAALGTPGLRETGESLSFDEVPASAANMQTTAGSLVFQTHHSLPAGGSREGTGEQSSEVPHAYRAASGGRTAPPEASRAAAATTSSGSSGAESLAFRSVPDASASGGAPRVGAASAPGGGGAARRPAPADYDPSTRTATVRQGDGHPKVRWRTAPGSASTDWVMNGATITVMRAQGEWLHVVWDGKEGVIKRRNTSLAGEGGGGKGKDGGGGSSGGGSVPRNWNAGLRGGDTPRGGQRAAHDAWRPCGTATPRVDAGPGGAYAGGAFDAPSARPGWTPDTARPATTPRGGAPRVPVDDRGFAKPRAIDVQRKEARRAQQAELESSRRAKGQKGAWKPAAEHAAVRDVMDRPHQLQ